MGGRSARDTYRIFRCLQFEDDFGRADSDVDASNRVSCKSFLTQSRS